jgi:hypothetical protein
MLGRIVKRCKFFMKCCTFFCANSIGARERAAHDGKIKSGKQNTVKPYRPNGKQRHSFWR